MQCYTPRYTRCYMHFTVMMVPMLQRVLYTPRILLLIHVLMWGMFALQVYWGGVMLQKAVLKFVLGKDVTTPKPLKSPAAKK